MYTREIRLAKKYQMLLVAIAIALFFFSFAVPQQASATAGTIKAVGMKFQGGYGTPEYSLSDYGTVIYDPIWLADNWGNITRDEPAAFARQGYIEIWVDISSPDIAIPSGGLWVEITMSGNWSSGGEAFASSTWIKYVTNWSDNESNTVSFLSNYISPSSRPIGRELLVLNWQFRYYINGSWYSGGSQGTVHRIFFPYQNPSGTWGEMTSEVLWKQAINFAGVLLDYAGPDTYTPDSVKYYNTWSIYFSGTEYDGEHSHHSGYYGFQMRSFLEDFYGSQPWADCRDTSSALQASSRALGIPLYSIKIDRDYYTKVVDPLGLIEDWHIQWWSYHQVASISIYDPWFGYLTMIWDPAIRVNQSSPILPRNMELEFLWFENYKDYMYGGPLEQGGGWYPGYATVISIVD